VSIASEPHACSSSDREQVGKAKRRPCHLCAVKEGNRDGAQAPAVGASSVSVLERGRRAHADERSRDKQSKNSDYYSIDYCVEWLVHRCVLRSVCRENCSST
jgi:hypothetical protein